MLLSDSLQSYAVSADGAVDYCQTAANAGVSANKALKGAELDNVDLPMVGSRLRPGDMSATIKQYEGLAGKTLLNTSHGGLEMGKPGSLSGVHRAPIADVYNMSAKSVQGKVLPPIIDPSSDFLSTSISVSRNPSFDIRGDPPIPMTDELLPPPLPTYGPYEPELENIQVGQYYPMKIDNAASHAFFSK